tara:strand:+ start:25734 stop:31181 length:5448 start_codon:yes stop_codon:yes gene_type:complete
MTDKYGIVPPLGTTAKDFNRKEDVSIPTSYSAGGWTYGNEGFAQQTFLGASIRDFTLNAGFGQTSSSLSLNLIEDEYNVSDKTIMGYGDDYYHNGKKDIFNPPTVGAPVYFKFGKNHARVDQVWQTVYNQTYIDPATGKHYELPNALPLSELFDSESIGFGGADGVETIENTSSETYRQKAETPPEKEPYDKINSIGRKFYRGVEGAVGQIYPTLPILTTSDPTADNEWIDKTKFLDTDHCGSGHLAFGGILQSFTENKGSSAAPAYAVNVSCPKELLGNVQLILSNYAGTTFNNANMLNIYGFLEHNPSDALFDALEAYYDNGVIGGLKNTTPRLNEVTRRIKPVLFTDPNPLASPAIYPKGGELFKVVNPANGVVSYVGDDLWSKSYVYPTPQVAGGGGIVDALPSTTFPITGTGFSRRNEEGIPIYRVVQAMSALMNYDGKLPLEYVQAGYGGPINFRGFNYVVDLTGLPLDMISPFYRLNYEQMTLLDFCSEICDITSHEMFVTLMPVIDHPSVEFVNDYNKWLAGNDPEWKSKIISGVIRVQGINKTAKPTYGTIKAVIDRITSNDNNVVNSDLGFELSNVVTDKFIVGANEVKMHYFSTNKDRDTLQVRRARSGFTNALPQSYQQWYHWKSLQQQVLPFYGFLGKEALTIPRGWGAFQQILLDSSSCDAVGVDSYYIATELELRAAAVSYERWSQFLLRYNNIYMESIEANDALESALLTTTLAPDIANGEAPLNTLNPQISNNFAVSVPRSVFISDKNFMGRDNLPASPSAPPFGYPLYYKRAEKIGIPEAGIVKIAGAINEIITNLATLKDKQKDAQQAEQLQMIKWTSARAELIADIRNKMNNSLGVAAKEGADAFITTFVTGLETVKPSNANQVLDEFLASESIGNFPNFIESTLQEFDVQSEQLVAATNKGDAITDQIGLLSEKLTNNLSLIRNKNRLAKMSMANARKVYNFVKGVADKHLGKTFLVKIPKDTNVFYQDAIILRPAGSKTSEVSEVQYGPFGFRPEPVNSEYGYYFGQAFDTQLNVYRQNAAKINPKRNTFDFLHAYNFVDSINPSRPEPVFSEGALKSSYDTIEEKWNFNYEPMAEGGFHDYSQMPQHYGYSDLRNIVANQGATAAYNIFPPCTRFNLFPIDTTNFVDANGRMKAYVRYDNSQFLNFKSVAPQRMTQQVIEHGGQWVPDLTQELDNMKQDKFVSFQSKGRLLNDRYERAIAFVQVDLDSKLYMPPKCGQHLTHVFGKRVTDIGTLVKPQMIFDKETCEFKPSYGYYNPHYVPSANGGRGTSKVKVVDFLRYRVANNHPQQAGTFLDLVATDPINLDGDNVYAMITIPGKVESTIDARYQDGPMQSYNPVDIKNLLTMDTVKIPEFRAPTVRGEPSKIGRELCDAGALDPDQISNAIKTVSEAFKAVSLASPERSMQFVTSSPIYPDMIALPLLSKERCYGPWISNSYSDVYQQFRARYLNVGGKIEYEKDEELAPWNYGGFDLLNLAGSTKASFANSELLYSERGGIVFAGPPDGNVLGKNLDAVGPLVTSVNVSVGDNGVQTTYKMDLYTPRFGKLQEQREQAIAQVGRTRQKMIDERNKALRGAASKSVTSSRNFSAEFARYSDIVEAAKSSSEYLSDLEKSSTYSDMIVASVNYSKTERHDGAGGKLENERVGFDVSMQPTKIFNEALSTLPQDVRDKKLKDTAGGHLSTFFAPASMDVSHPAGMPAVGYHPEKARQDFYYEIDNSGEVKTVVTGLPTFNPNAVGGSTSSQQGGFGIGGQGEAPGAGGGILGGFDQPDIDSRPNLGGFSEFGSIFGPGGL